MTPGHCLPTRYSRHNKRKAAKEPGSLPLHAGTLCGGSSSGWKFAVCILWGSELLAHPRGRKAAWMRSQAGSYRSPPASLPCYWVTEATQLLRVAGRARAWETVAHALRVPKGPTASSRNGSRGPRRSRPGSRFFAAPQLGDRDLATQGWAGSRESVGQDSVRARQRAARPVSPRPAGVPRSLTQWLPDLGTEVPDLPQTSSTPRTAQQHWIPDAGRRRWRGQWLRSHLSVPARARRGHSPPRLNTRLSTCFIGAAGSTEHPPAPVTHITRNSCFSLLFLPVAT